MRWLIKQRKEVIRKWKNNEISMADAALELHQLGIPALTAWDILART